MFSTCASLVRNTEIARSKCDFKIFITSIFYDLSEMREHYSEDIKYSFIKRVNELNEVLVYKFFIIRTYGFRSVLLHTNVNSSKKAVSSFLSYSERKPPPYSVFIFYSPLCVHNVSNNVRV